MVANRLWAQNRSIKILTTRQLWKMYKHKIITYYLSLKGDLSFNILYRILCWFYYLRYEMDVIVTRKEVFNTSSSGVAVCVRSPQGFSGELELTHLKFKFNTYNQYTSVRTNQITQVLTSKWWTYGHTHTLPHTH